MCRLRSLHLVVPGGHRPRGGGECAGRPRPTPHPAPPDDRDRNSVIRAPARRQAQLDPPPRPAHRERPRGGASAALAWPFPTCPSRCARVCSNAAEVIEVPPGGQCHRRRASRQTRCTWSSSGTVQLSVHQRQHDLAVATVGPGELLGWSWLVPPHRWDFDASSPGRRHPVAHPGRRCCESVMAGRSGCSRGSGDDDGGGGQPSAPRHPDPAARPLRTRRSREATVTGPSVLDAVDPRGSRRDPRSGAAPR